MTQKDKILDRAQKYIQKGNLDKAIAEYKDAAVLDPKDVTIRLRLGELYVKLNKTPDAIKEYTEAAKMNAQRGFYLKAIAVYKQILKLDDNLETHYKLADLYTKQRLNADAVSEYSFIVSTFEKRGKTNEVMELLKKMVGIDPDNVGVRLKLADLYQKLSFDKDALAEYSGIFEKLLDQGKLDKAEKLYLNLYSSNSREPVILKGLSLLYRKKNDVSQFLKFSKPLFQIYMDTGETEAAREVSGEILEFKPDDADCRAYMERSGQKAEAPAAPVKHWTEEPPAAVKEPPKAESAAPEAPVEEKPLIPWPEEEIEITLEGFEEAASETVKGAKEAFKEEEFEVKAEAQSETPSAVEGMEAPGETGIKHEAEVKVEAEEEAPEVELEIEEEPVPAAPVEEAEAEVEAKEEPPVEEEVSFEVKETVPVEDAFAAAAEEAAEALEGAEKTVEEIASIDESELKDIMVEIEEETGAEAAVAAPSEESIEEALEEAIEEVNLKISEAEESSEGAEGVELIEEPVEEGSAALIEPAVEEPEAPAEVLLEEAAQASGIEEEGAATEAAPGVEAQAPSDEPVFTQEEISGAIDELIEKTGGEPESTTELIDKVEPQDMLLEPEKVRMEEAPERGRGEEYVDLSAELGMEETIQDMAGSWGGADSKETYDEFKSGIGQQLSKEDTETHYNLGIAYMEMELYSEAAKEFKIALKDPHLEFDCFIRLGLCAMAESNPREAITYYLKGLKIEGRSDDERMGMMYELALAYEAAGDRDEANHLFNSIYDTDPGYREVSKKVTLGAPRIEVPLIPLDDGLIEVELL